MKKDNANKLYDIFLEHYEIIKQDPQTVIMQKADGRMLKSPLFISWEIMADCNLSCVHCRAAYNNSRSKLNYYSLEEYYKVLKEFSDLEVMVVGITGGEPLLHPFFWEILKESRKYHFDIIIYTNGTLIRDSEAKKLADLLRPEDIVHVSLDGGTSEANDKQRGEGCFNKTIQALTFLKKYKVPVRLNMVPTIHNVESIPELCDIAIEMGVKEFGASPLMLTGRAEREIMPNQQLLFQMEEMVAERLRNSETQYIGGISGTVHSYLYLHEWFDDNIYNLKREGKKYRLCDAGNRKVFVDAGGDVYPCSLFAAHKEFVVGNVFSSHLDEIWGSNKLVKFRQGIVIEDNKCINCKLLPLCNGGCMALAYHKYGKLGAIDPRCKARERGCEYDIREQ